MTNGLRDDDYRLLARAISKTENSGFSDNIIKACDNFVDYELYDFNNIETLREKLNNDETHDIQKLITLHFI
jgi:hypothetical protein